MLPIKEKSNRLKYYVICRKQKGLAYKIYLRLDYKGNTAEMHTGYSIEYKEDFCQQERLPKDQHKKAEILNAIDQLKSYFYELLRGGNLTHPSQVIAAYLDKPVMGINMIASWNEFMKNQEKEVKIGILSKGTIKNYYTTGRYLKQFIQDLYKRKDVPVSMFGREMIDKFNFWLAENTQCGKAGCSKNLERLKKFGGVLLSYDHISKHPFQGYKFRKDVKPRTFLTEAELDQIRKIHPPSEKLKLVRDIFLFMANTGLAYSDVKSLKKNK